MDNLLKERVQDLVKEYGITVKQLEIEAGIKQGNIKDWGEHVPSIEKVVKVADYFGVSVDFLLGRAPAQPRRKTERIDLLDADDRRKVDAIIEAFLEDAKYKKSDKVGV